MSEADKIRVRRHMGYPAVDNIQTIQHSVPAGLQTLFALNSTLEKITESLLPEVLRWCSECECTECEVFGNKDMANVESVGTVKVNRLRLRELRDTYLLAQQNLANVLGSVPNPFDQRQWLSGGGGIGNGRVFNG